VIILATEIIELKTDDPEVAHDALNELYGADQPMVVSGDPTDFLCEFEIASGETVGSDRVRHTMSARSSMAPTGFFLAATLISGTLERFVTDREEHRLGGGDVVLYPADQMLLATWDDIELATVRIPFEVIERTAAERCEKADPVRFTGMRPISPRRGRSWERLTSFVRGQMVGSSPVVEQPILEAQLAELIAAMALMTFPNSAVRIDHAPRRAGTSGAAVRRGVAFIEENAGVPITLSEIAEAAGVGPRTLQRGFARHLETSPTAYLARIRLRRARGDLLAADPESTATVEAVARRWGFADATRFAVAYRALHGHPPGVDLAA
jgi:AraC-like DNA-binding protein